MSTMDALEKFMRNPRPYILNPQPQNPCKLCIVGPPLSGKTTLAKHLASKYGATVRFLYRICENSRLHKNVELFLATSEVFRQVYGIYARWSIQHHIKGTAMNLFGYLL